jgi:AhpD family alkylhydroperoxidase
VDRSPDVIRLRRGLRTPLWRKAMRARARGRRQCPRGVARVREAGDRVLALLVNGRDEDGGGLSDEEVRLRVRRQDRDRGDDPVLRAHRREVGRPCRASGAPDCHIRGGLLVRLVTPREEEIMPRIPGVPTKEAGPLLRVVYWYAKRRLGAVPEPFTVLARHRKLFMASARHEMATEKASTVLPANVRELAVYRVAQQLGCSWCVDFGTYLQKSANLDIERLEQIDAYETSPAYSRQERLAIAYADAMSATPTRATDEQVAELVAEFGREGVLELTYQIGLENMRARMYSALDVCDQGFTSGDACRIPVPADAPAPRNSGA